MSVYVVKAKRRQPAGQWVEQTLSIEPAEVWQMCSNLVLSADEIFINNSFGLNLIHISDFSILYPVIGENFTPQVKEKIEALLRSRMN